MTSPGPLLPWAGTWGSNHLKFRSAPSYDLLATASLCERGPDGRCKKLDQGRDVRNRFNIEDGLLNRRLAI
jgi:hypothetical protein